MDTTNYEWLHREDETPSNDRDAYCAQHVTYGAQRGAVE